MGWPVKDLTGANVGRWFVVRRARAKRRSNDGHMQARFLCVCSCPAKTERIVLAASLVSGKSQSCGCVGHEKAAAVDFEDLSGRTVKSFTVLAQQKVMACPNGKRERHWLCRCSCPAGTVQWVRASELKAGKTGHCPSCAPQYAADCRVQKKPAGLSGFSDQLRRYKENAAKREIEWHLSDAQANFLFTHDCFYCELPPSKVRAAHNEHTVYRCAGIDRVDPNGDYTAENSVPCCEPCNLAKRLFTLLAFALYHQRIRSMGRGHPYEKEDQVYLEWLTKHATLVAELRRLESKAA